MSTENEIDFKDPKRNEYGDITRGGGYPSPVLPEPETENTDMSNDPNANEFGDKTGKHSRGIAYAILFGCCVAALAGAFFQGCRKQDTSKESQPPKNAHVMLFNKTKTSSIV